MGIKLHLIWSSFCICKPNKSGEFSFVPLRNVFKVKHSAWSSCYSSVRQLNGIIDCKVTPAYMYSTVRYKDCDRPPIDFILFGWKSLIFYLEVLDISMLDKRERGGASQQAMLTNQNSCFSRLSVDPCQMPPTEVYI